MSLFTYCRVCYYDTSITGGFLRYVYVISLAQETRAVTAESGEHVVIGPKTGAGGGDPWVVACRPIAANYNNTPDGTAATHRVRCSPPPPLLSFNPCPTGRTFTEGA